MPGIVVVAAKKLDVVIALVEVRGGKSDCCRIPGISDTEGTQRIQADDFPVRIFLSLFFGTNQSRLKGPRHQDHMYIPGRRSLPAWE